MWQILVPPRSDHARIPHLVQERHDNVVLLYALPVEVLSRGLREILFALPSVDGFPGHRGGAETDARLRKHPVLVGVGEGSRCVESVFTPIVVENVSIEGRPLQLHTILGQQI